MKAPIFAVVAPSISSSCIRWSKAKTRISEKSPPCSRPRLVAQCTCSSSPSLRRSERTMPRSRKNSSSAQRGIGRGAAVARDGEGAAGVGELEARRPVLSGKPAAKQPGEEAVAGTEHVEDLDGETRPGLPVVEAVGDRQPRRRRRLQHPACRPAWRPTPLAPRAAPRWYRWCRRRCGTPLRCRRSGRRSAASFAGAPSPPRSRRSGSRLHRGRQRPRGSAGSRCRAPCERHACGRGSAPSRQRPWCAGGSGACRSPAPRRPRR